MGGFSYKMHLTYKIGSSYKYPTNNVKIDNGGIGVEFRMNGSIFLFRDGIPSYIKNEDIKSGNSKFYGEIIELDPLDCIYFRVNEYMDENQPGFEWKWDDNIGDMRRISWRETNEIILPTRNLVGTSEEHSEDLTDRNLPEHQIFRNGMYGKYTYGEYWNETKSGIDLSEWKGACYLEKEYWITDKHFKKTKRKDGKGYFYDSNNNVTEPRKIKGSRSEFRLKNISEIRKSAVRELRFKKLLDK